MLVFPNVLFEIDNLLLDSLRLHQGVNACGIVLDAAVVDVFLFVDVAVKLTLPEQIIVAQTGCRVVSVVDRSLRQHRACVLVKRNPEHRPK